MIKKSDSKRWEWFIGMCGIYYFSILVICYDMGEGLHKLKVNGLPLLTFTVFLSIILEKYVPYSLRYTKKYGFWNLN